MGFVLIGPQENNEHTIELYAIYVRPEWWVRGLAGNCSNRLKRTS
jgi:hypothetical protein